MPVINFTDTLQEEYKYLYSTMEIRLNKLPIIEQHVDRIFSHKSRYQAAGEPIQLPWYFIGIIHSMECGQNFSCHLHNGDPLTARTVKVPKGRPTSGNPPFTWEASTADALLLKRLNEIDDWSLPRVLYEMERYNGWGYRRYHPYVKSPYLWSFSNHYTSGKYIADGTWSETAVSAQVGAAVLLRRMEERNIIPPFTELPARKSFFRYSTKQEPRAADLQRFLNSFNGIALLVDGVPGKKTSEAVEKIFGFPLSETPK